MRTRLRPLPLAAASVAVLAVGIGAWSPASEADTTPAACTSVGPSLTDFTAVLTLPKFDPALGTLTGVTLSGSEQVSMRIRVENEGPTPYLMGGDIGVVGRLTVPTGQAASTSSAYSHREMLPAYDGTTDWSGSGFDTGPITNGNEITPIQISGADLAAYVGPGTFDSTYIADGNSTFDGPGVSTYWFESTASATVCVSYAYTVATTTSTTTTMPTTSTSTSTTVPPSTTSTSAPGSTTSTSTTVAPSTTTTTTAPCSTSTTTTLPPSTTVASTTPLSTTTTPASTTSTTTPGCPPATTTSTTAPATATTTPRTTTTVGPGATTTVVGPTSSIAPEVEVEPTTVDTTTVVPGVPVGAPPAPSSLPRTGSEPLPLLLVGAGLLGSGASLVAWRRGQRAAGARTA